MPSSCVMCGAELVADGRACSACRAGKRPDPPPSVEVIDEPLPAHGGAFRAPGHGSATRLELRLRWDRSRAWPLVPFLLVWWAIPTIGCAIGGPRIPPLPGLLLLAAYVCAGAALTYFTLATLFNRTAISIDRSELEVRHGPIPWIGARTIQVDRVRAVHVRDDGTAVDPGPYALSVDLDGASVDLLSSHEALVEVRYLADALRAHLGLTERTA